jgi:hypothetical protein
MNQSEVLIQVDYEYCRHQLVLLLLKLYVIIISAIIMLKEMMLSWRWRETRQTRLSVLLGRERSELSYLVQEPHIWLLLDYLFLFWLN